MIRNIIFDMGRVLIRFEPEYFIGRMGIADEDDVQQLLTKVFRAPGWSKMDTGELTEELFEQQVRAALPERLHLAAHKLIFEWDQPILPIPGMAELVKDCKEAGLGIYLLSNASIRQKEYWPRIPGSEFFDGRIVSAEHRMVKPDLRIYRLLLDTYHLKAEECLFVDDVKENIEAAEKAGIAGHLFCRAEDLRAYINVHFPTDSFIRRLS